MADALLPPPTNTIEGIYVPDGVIPDTLRKWGYFPDVDSWYAPRLKPKMKISSPSSKF